MARSWIAVGMKWWSVKCTMRGCLSLACLLLFQFFPYCQPNHDAKRLYDDLLMKSKYNRLIRPVPNSSDTLTVKLGLKLSQLVDVDEKNEIVSTNMWVIQEWDDHSLRWEPVEYGGVTKLYVPSTALWLPDIVLYNNADGDYTVTMMTKATLNWHGQVRWEPPAIYKSQCNIEVQYFPFDQQECILKFGSWTYDGFKVDLKHIKHELGTEETALIENAIDLADYYRSVEWDLLTVPARKNIKSYPCCAEPYPDITFNFTIRRKILYYSINLIIPCVSINMLTLLGFYLPCDCGEKISICISILLSLSLFQLLLMELVPATSTATPLMGAYILFTNILVSISVFSSVIVLNVKYRGSSTHGMPRLTKWFFLEVLPKILFMKRPEIETDDVEIDWDPGQSDMSNLENPYKTKMIPLLMSDESGEGLTQSFIGIEPQNSDQAAYCDACTKRRKAKYPPQVSKGLDGIQFVAKRVNTEDTRKKFKEDWLYMAMVIDRFLLWIYTTGCIVGVLGMLLNAPALYNKDPSIGVEA